MGERSQPERVWFWVAPLLAWFATAYSAPLITHLYFVLFRQEELGNCMYGMFPFVSALSGLVVGIIPAALVVVQLRLKPNFALVSSRLALGWIAFWTVVVIVCQCIFVPERFVSSMIMLLLAFTLWLPLGLLWLLEVPAISLFGLPHSLLITCLLLVAFYFTPPRGWGSRREIEK